MSEAGLYMGWGAVSVGREKHALKVFGDTVQYFERLKNEGKVENFEVVILRPSGEDVGGFFLIRGTAQQIDALRRDDEFEMLENRVLLIADRLMVTDATVDDGIGPLVANYQQIVDELT